MKNLLLLLLFILNMPLVAQVESIDEIEFEPDSITKPYKAANKNYAFIRSKRGSGGVAKTSKADSIIPLTINEIVLVFTELDPSALEGREEANRERWENLLKTYPELFQFSTTYKNLCQCNDKGDSAAFKKAQGFYIYFAGEDPPVAEKSPEVKTAKNEEKKADEVKQKKAPAKETEVEERSSKKNDEESVREKKKKEPKKEKEAPVAEEPKEEAIVNTKETVKAPPVKRAGYAKPRRSKEAKACGTPCYENGDEDLNAFFRDYIVLTKKQRKHSKDLVSLVRLQLNFDGSIKKAIVTGANEELNKQVTEAINKMNLWNPAVKNGVTVKSEVRITLKYDRGTKSMQAAEVMIIPKPLPKCKCITESELVGS